MTADEVEKGQVMNRREALQLLAPLAVVYVPSIADAVPSPKTEPLDIPKLLEKWGKESGGDGRASISIAAGQRYFGNDGEPLTDKGIDVAIWVSLANGASMSVVRYNTTLEKALREAREKMDLEK